MSRLDHPATHTRLDAHALRVLAHPLRARLLSQLRLEGPATATSLARALDTNTGATSYHLRKLAEVGLVEESEGGRGRERMWQAVHELHSWLASDFSGDPDNEAASAWLQGEALRNFQQSAVSWLENQTRWSNDWRDAAGPSNYLLELSADQLAEMMQEVHDLIERHRKAVPGDGAARVLVYLYAFPQSDRGRS